MATFEEEAKAIQTGVPLIAPSARRPIMGDAQPATTDRTGWRVLLSGMDRPTYGVKPGLAEARAMSQERRSGPAPLELQRIDQIPGLSEVRSANYPVPPPAADPAAGSRSFSIRGEAPIDAELVDSPMAERKPSTFIDPSQGTSIYDLGFDPSQGGHSGWAGLKALQAVQGIATDAYNRKFNARKLMEGSEKDAFDQQNKQARLGIDRINARTALKGMEAAVAKAGEEKDQDFSVEAPYTTTTMDDMGQPVTTTKAGRIKVGETVFPVADAAEYDYMMNETAKAMIAANASRTVPLTPKEQTEFRKHAMEALSNRYQLLKAEAKAKAAQAAQTAIPAK